MSNICCDERTNTEIEKTQRAMLRMLKIKIKDKISVNKIRVKTKFCDIGYRIKKLKLKYAGHMAMGDRNRWHLLLTQ